MADNVILFYTTAAGETPVWGELQDTEDTITYPGTILLKMHLAAAQSYKVYLS